jgi:hypothetical protein
VARRGVATKPQLAAPAGGGDDDIADPWFTPGPKADAGYQPSEPAADHGIGADDTAEWFLPTGRAGLQPESMTESSWDDQGEVLTDRVGRREAAGAPPWGPDSASTAAGEPPPWENGPWPGPGALAARKHQAPSAAPKAGARAGSNTELSLLGLLRTRLVLAIGAAVVVVVVAVVVIVISLPGGPAGGCATYPAVVHQAYARAMNDLNGHADASTLAADLGQAASLANQSAAAEGQITARTALFAMASHLDEAHADVIAHRAVPTTLLQRLTADGTALPASC